MKKQKLNILILLIAVLIPASLISQFNNSKFNFNTNVSKNIKSNKTNKSNFPLSQINLDGTWYWNSNNGSNNLELYLNQINNSVTGKHCSSFLNGSKLDCVDEDDLNSVNLNLISPNVYEGTLKSSFSDVIVSVRITLNPTNETILFEQLNQPNEEYYLPNNVTMTLAQE